MYFQCGRFRLPFTRPLVMGILNLTPDSFFDGARYPTLEAACMRAQRMVEEGADLIDIGGESTRPGAIPVSAPEEIGRVIPAVRVLRNLGIPLSVDTYKPEVMRAALDAGADLINDVQGFRQPGALDAVRASHCGVCVMHMLGAPQTMQRAPSYQDVVTEVAGFLRERVKTLEASGIARARIAIDPGFGFGKTIEHNLTLLARLPELALPDIPLLAGLSRKSTLGAVTGRAPRERLAASIAAAVCAAQRGARIIRVHDVGPTVDALKIGYEVQKKEHP
ncbi:Dihydropteroate synthase (DHPS) (Dihydropteroate pyrophosphorylase) [Candidatus Glomeribacter gigasporarum BEG34]|uniref:dihydropteroate synthase n=2 Tax=Candidatus Glomeribacter gigasporarum TaxID=132144 RepID=G2J9N6_9BURK|nr:Dihydropteroate synthase (DHPS) (Dihydropteroate pyrophosphorylase) [Candidatus Glomeribacter gigasporarum BEG34]